MNTNFSNKNILEINTNGIESVKEKYFEKIGEHSINNISLEKANKLFIFVIEDFKKGILSPDELSSFGFDIFHGVAKLNPKSDLFQASLSASDLRFEIRTKGERIPQCLEDINNFYEKNK
jgi:hypothetical protein